MTSINRLDRSLAGLRKALAESKAAKTGKAEKSGNAQTGAIKPEERVKKLKERIHGRLADLDLSVPEHQVSAASIFLETVLANEFGSELLQDPSFHNLLADVRQTMLNDPATQQDFLTMLAELQAGKD